MMTKNTRKRFYNLNLFLLVVALGFLMYWHKNVRVKKISFPQSLQTGITTHIPIHELPQAKLKK